ncbi:MAG TPA: hypothetical protein VMU77_06735 [Acidimicrobiales bacterium]|nr:hypothetical protein [Acidimicrobiales bacterium]
MGEGSVVVGVVGTVLGGTAIVVGAEVGDGETGVVMNEGPLLLTGPCEGIED